MAAPTRIIDFPHLMLLHSEVERNQRRTATLAVTAYLFFHLYPLHNDKITCPENVEYITKNDRISKRRLWLKPKPQLFPGPSEVYGSAKVYFLIRFSYGANAKPNLMVL